MTISFSGLGSGLDYASWIDQLVAIKQQSVTNIQDKNTTLQTQVNAFSSLKQAYTSLQTSLNSFLDVLVRNSANNVFTKCKATSSNNAYVTASVDPSTPAQNVSVKISQLATNTVAQSPSNTASYITGDTKYSDIAAGNVQAGTVVFNLDNQKLSVDINTGDTMDVIMQKFQDAASGVGKNLDVTLQDGKLSFSSDSQLSFTTASTSDFTSVMGLKMNADKSGYTSMNPIMALNSNGYLLPPANSNSPYCGIDGITAGTFTIGGAQFTIDKNTTMNGLISQINANSDAGVNASFDQSTGKLKLTSKTSGELYISVDAPSADNGGSNFTDVMGLTQNGSLIQDNQTLGQNAMFSVNGVDKEYINNTIPPSVSGVSGLTLTLNKVTDDTTGDMSVSVANDPTDLINALQSFVTNYNNIVNLTSNLTTMTPGTDSSGQTTYTPATLSFDSTLTMLTSQLRNQVMGQYTSSSSSSGSSNSSGNSVLSLLSQLGISTQAPGASLTDNTNTLSFDQTKFLAAFNADPSAVQNLLIGPNNTDTGLLGQINKVVGGVLDSTNGYFAVQTQSLNTQMQNNNDKISKATDAVAAYKATLTTQFQNMDLAMQKLNSQYANMTSILSSINSGKSG